MATNHMWPSTCTDTQLSIIAETPAGWRFRGRSAPAVAGLQGGGDDAEASGVEDGTLATDILRVDLEDAGHFRFARAPLPVPGPGADVNVVVCPARVAVVVLAGQHEAEQIAAAVAHQQHRAVLAARVV